MVSAMPLVTLSASYGAGGSEVGPALARRLDVPFVDRAVPSSVARELAGTVDGGVFWRLLRNVSPVASWTAAGIHQPPALDARLADRADTEAALRALMADGRGVILGRAGALALRDDPRALHVRLDGPLEARVVQAMRIEGVDEATGRRRLKETDGARERYVRDLYGVDPTDPALYALVLDGTILDLECCVQTIAAAALAHAAAAGAGTPA
jgi:cytidylate kinase